MYKPLISVIIPVYNRRAFLQKAVDSVFAQTYQNIEVIIIDDGSNKLTRKVLAKYSNPKIRVLRQRHLGVSSARNRGILAAKGELIAFLDSDDIWHPEKLEKQLLYLDKHPECMICQTDELWIRNGKRVNPRLKHKKLHGLFFYESLHLCLVTTSSVLCKKELFEKVGLFDDDLPVCEDYDFYLRILSLKIPVCLLPERLMTRYAGHHDQLSNSYPAMDRFRIKTLIKLLKKSNLSEGQEAEIKNILQKKLNILIQGAARRKKFLSWTKYLLLKYRFVR